MASRKRHPAEMREHAAAIGGTARVIVNFADGHETTLDLSQLA
jgi:hypothetical protein